MFRIVGQSPVTGNRLMLRAIFWDNDGVLVDTERLYYDATRATLATAGMELTEDVYEDLSLRQGLSVFELLRRRGGNEEEIARLRAERDAVYLRLLQERPLVIEGVEDTLSALHGKLTMGVVTSAQKVHFDTVHRASGLGRYFDFVLTREDYERSKPDPEPYLAALRHTGFGPDECIVIEDTERGLLSARAAGIRCIAIPNRLIRRGDFSAAHAVLGSVRDVAPEVLRLAETAPRPT
jgi:HAD superfamily hydrolase (TIGR01509 family)